MQALCTHLNGARLRSSSNVSSSRVSKLLSSQLIAAPCSSWGAGPSSRHQATNFVVASTSGAASDTSTSSTASTSTSNIATEMTNSPRQEAKLTMEQYKVIYDRLIKIFQERPRDDWKKLIVFSKQWSEHSQGVFNRIKELSDQEQDIDKKMALRKLFRALQNVNDELTRYNTMLAKFRDAKDDEWEPIVAVHRGDLQKGFFEHMQCLMAAEKGDQAKLDALVMMNTRLVALVSNHDSVTADQEKLAQAAEVYRDLLSSVESIEEVDKKMSELASAGKIDPAFLHISAKAYGAARDTNMSIDEAKWVSYKLYRNARDHFERQQPAEKRIIEYLISIADPSERRNALDKAVTPGPQRFTDTHDYLWATPQRLFLVLDTTLKAYSAMQGAAVEKLGTSKESILPRKVRTMMELRDEIMRRYL